VLVQNAVARSRQLQPKISSRHCVDELITVFNSTFSESENTVLEKGDGEPIYLPSTDSCNVNRVVFAHGFFSSALHEIAHWCVAGPARRQLVDYGYWYAPDGRNAEQQQEFEAVEVLPQAMEWIFAKACEKRFSVSVDNLSGIDTDPLPFKTAVHEQVMRFCHAGLTGRASLFHRKLCYFYKTPSVLSADHFSISSLSM